MCAYVCECACVRAIHGMNEASVATEISAMCHHALFLRHYKTTF